MTAITETTEIKVAKIQCAIADLIVGYTVYVEDDGSGPYISLHNPADDEDYRCLSLSEESCSEDLSLYLWRFWNSGKANLWLDSTLTAEATTEEVLAFLAECLAEEAREISAMS
jgi:hypothetical protein